jgi:hypothetical protein
LSLSDPKSPLKKGEGELYLSFLLIFETICCSRFQLLPYYGNQDKNRALDRGRIGVFYALKYQKHIGDDVGDLKYVFTKKKKKKNFL